jgi:uncharacterized membrane-anchored protein
MEGAIPPHRFSREVLLHLPLNWPRWKRAIVLIALVSLAGTAQAQTPPSGAPDHKAELEAAWDEAFHVAVKGPAPITLRDQATLQLPAGELFLPQTQTERILRAWGNRPNDTLVGMIVGTGDDDRWSVVIRYVKDGYIKDDDARDWNAADMLSSLRDGTEQANRERVQRGFPELDVIGWVEPPAYDATTHRLVWSLSARDRGAPADQPQIVNYNTYALGRDGYFSLNLLSSSARVENEKPIVRALLASLDYKSGKRYDDFVGATDKVAAYGLAALIGVVAVKKIGLLAGLGILLLKIWKVGLLAIAGVAAAVKRFFKRTPSAGA